MDDEGETEYISEPLILDTEDRLTAELTPRNENGRESTASDSELSQLLKKLELRSALPVTSMSSFMAAVSIIDPPFKLRTRHRPWSISAGQGAHGSVEVHRYVPGRNFNVFNDSSPLKLVAYNPYPKRTGEYYAVKRLLPHDEEKTPTSRGPNRFALLANELRILAHGDLRGHPNIVFLFGVSHMPPRSGPNLAEPNLVLQEGDCGDLFSFYRESDLGFNRQKLVEIKMSLLFDITCGLAALHHHGVVHCDLKPQNILIRRRNGRDTDIHPVKSEMEAGQVAIEALIGQSTFVAILADFGGSLIVSDHTGNTVRPEVWTPLWGAPELYSSTPISKDLLPRTDIYSAGLIFAFILLEGRDIFTKVIHRGRMHQYDVTMSKDDVCAQKVSGEALGLAKAAVADFQVMLFDVTADGNRIYESMNTMYHPAQVGIFNNILELALQLDPSRRVRDATDLIGPWAQALQENSHVRNYVHYPQQGTFNSYYSGTAGGRDYFRKPRVCARSSGPCTVVPSAFPDSSAELSPGVFDVSSILGHTLLYISYTIRTSRDKWFLANNNVSKIRKSFKVFRASLTSGLKTEILNDLLLEVDLLQSIQLRLAPHTVLSDVVPASQLRRAADCAYQLAVAYMEGFGIARSDQDALKWMKTSAEWGCASAQADCIALSEAIRLPDVDQEGSSNDMAVSQWAATAIGSCGKQNAVNSLWRSSKTLCDAALTTYRTKRMTEIWTAFDQQTSLDHQELFGPRYEENLSLYFTGSGVDQSIGQENGWTILHYAAIAGRLDAIKFLVEKLSADVRSLSSTSETPLDVAAAFGHVDIVYYLVERHKLCEPHFRPGSCPLQNIAFLPADLIMEVTCRILSVRHALNIDIRNQATARTALMNTMLTTHPLNPDARNAAINTLLLFGSNPLLTAIGPGTSSPLLLAVLEVDDKLVSEMLNAITMCKHTLPLLDQTRARPEPANELARSYLRLMQTPRAITLTRGSRNYRQAYKNIIEMMVKMEISVELPFVSRAIKHDSLGLACYYGKDEAMQVILNISDSSGASVSKTLSTVSGIDAALTAIDCGFSEAIDTIVPRMMTRLDVTNYNLLVSAVHHQPDLIPRVYSHFERAGRGPELLSYIDPWGATAFDLAMEYGYLDLAQFLLDKGATYDVYRLKGDHTIDDGEQSTLASVLPRMKPIRFLMELTPKPRLIVTNTGLNVFHILASDESLVMTTVGRAEFLNTLAYFYKMDPSLIHARGGSQGLTPFHLVSLHYSEIVGAFLHEHGADINALSTAGHTPLDLLHFHGAGEGSHEQRLTIDCGGETLRTGVTICDYAVAGPAYWIKEGKLSARMKSLYSDWGAERSTGLHSICLR